MIKSISFDRSFDTFVIPEFVFKKKFYSKTKSPFGNINLNLFITDHFELSKTISLNNL